MSAAPKMLLMTEDQLRRIVAEAVQEGVGKVLHAPKHWYTTEQAADYLCTTPKALRDRVAAGKLVPDTWGGRGRGASHLFSRETLDRHAKES